jgi:electron transfer flavoprotein beta subunit
MADVLVCVKRVPDSSSEVVLTEDAQAVDGRYAGFTTSPHVECAVELAVQITAATGGEVSVLTLGDADAVEQLRSALAVGATAATLVETDASKLGPADVAREVAAGGWATRRTFGGDH